MHDGRNRAKLYQTFITNSHLKSTLCAPLSKEHSITRRKTHAEKSQLEASVFTGRQHLKTPQSFFHLFTCLIFKYYFQSLPLVLNNLEIHGKMNMSNNSEAKYESEMKTPRRWTHRVRNSGCVCAERLKCLSLSSTAVPDTLSCTKLTLSYHAPIPVIPLSRFRKAVCKLWRQEMLHISAISYIIHLPLHLSYRYEGRYIQ